MKMKELDPGGGAARGPWRPPLDPPMMMYFYQQEAAIVHATEIV